MNFEKILAVFLRSIRLFDSSLAAIVGLFLFPFVKLLRWGAEATVITLFAGIVFPAVLILCFGFAAASAELYLNIGFPFDWIIGFAAVAGLTTITALIFPAVLAGKTFEVIRNSLVEGVTMGWTEGLSSLFKRALDHITVDVVHNIRNIRDSYIRLRAILPSRSNTSFKLDSLKLSDAEFRVLKQDRKRLLQDRETLLTVDERARLELSVAESERIPALKARLARQEELGQEDAELIKTVDAVRAYDYLNNLKTVVSPISFERPSRPDTILLVKEYQDRGEWLPVPHGAHIFGMSELKTWIDGGQNQTHPITRDNLHSCRAYTIRGIDHPTRFVYHPFYDEDDESLEGLSQELNRLIPYLRARAAQRPIPAAIEVAHYKSDLHHSPTHYSMT